MKNTVLKRKKKECFVKKTCFVGNKEKPFYIRQICYVERMLEMFTSKPNGIVCCSSRSLISDFVATLLTNRIQRASVGHARCMHSQRAAGSCPQASAHQLTRFELHDYASSVVASVNILHKSD